MPVLALILCLLLGAPAQAALPGVTELATSPAQLPDATLATLLGERIASADVVAIGESVHGSAGMLHIQTRLIRHLIERHGVRLIVWENPTLRSLELARWVAACAEKAAAPPLDVLYMPTAADLPLWTWVCEFNRAHQGDPIVLRGMDVWDRPWEHYARLRELNARLRFAPRLIEEIAATCPAYDAASWSDIDLVFVALARDGGFRPEAGYARCRTALAALMDAARNAARTRRQARDSSADAAFELALSASTLAGWLGFYNYQWSHDVHGWNERDRAQGRNLMLLMEQHGTARAVLSAHTSHVSHNGSAADWWGYGDLKSGVHFFSALSGRKVFNIALTAYRASGTQGDWSFPVAANSMDKTLYAAGHRFAFFTAEAAFLTAHPRWWMQNGNTPGKYESGVEIVPRDHFDAYFFLGESHLDRALQQRDMWRP